MTAPRAKPLATKSLQPQWSGERAVLVPEMMARLGVRSRTTVHSYIQTGVLPPPRKFGPRRTGWPASEIETWFANRELAA